MNYFIYEAYRKQFKKDLVNGIKSMPKVMKIPFFSWLIIVFADLFVMLIIPSNVTYCVFAVVSTIATVFLCGFAKIYNRKNLDTRIDERKNRLKELKKWLEDEMDIKDKNATKQLRNKMRIVINARRKSIDKVESILFKILELLCVPVLLTVFSFVLESGDMGVAEKIQSSAAVLIIGVLIVVSVLLLAYTVITEIIKNEQHYYEMFVDDLQDVLDTQYDIKHEDILNIQ